MRNTTLQGDITEAQIAAALVAAGQKLLRPVSSASRYDLLIDHENGCFTRIQCKTGVLQGGRVVFRLYSISGHTNVAKHYAGQVDAFGVYCQETGETYLVPVDALADCQSAATLRVSAARNGQRSGTRPAEQFRISAELLRNFGVPPQDQHAGGEAVQEVASADGTELPVGEEAGDGHVAVGPADRADVVTGLPE